MMPDLFRLEKVSKHYTRGKEILNIFENLDFALTEGDFVAVMGPSGSGKTTLLNLLGGIDQINSGVLKFKNEHLEKMSESRLSSWRAKNVGFIFQFYNLMPMLNARQNIELPLLLTNRDSKTRKTNVDTALEVVGLTDRAKHFPKQLSGGQQQRVAIARAIVADPALLLCDEPTGDLDRATADSILEMLQILNQELGKTIVMVTHDPEAAKYAKRTLYLDKGVFLEGKAENA